MGKTKIAVSNIQYEHLGVDISYQPSAARFVAEVEGKVINSPSLQGIKTAIEHRLAAKMEPFPALDIHWNIEKPEKVEVVGVYKDRYLPEHKWKLASGQLRSAHSIVPDTKEVRAILKQLAAYERETRRMEAKRRAGRKVIYDKLPKMKTPIDLLIAKKLAALEAKKKKEGK